MVYQRIGAFAITKCLIPSSTLACIGFRREGNFWETHLIFDKKIGFAKFDMISGGGTGRLDQVSQPLRPGIVIEGPKHLRPGIVI